MNEYGTKIAEDAVRFKRLLPGPVERVWQFLVESEKRKLWLCAGVTELESGGLVEMHFNNASLSDQPDIPKPEKFRDLPEQVSFSGKVTRFEEPRMLAHTWEFEGETSEVCYELEAMEDKVLLTLTHRRLSSEEEMLDVCAGWHTHLDILIDVLESRPARAFWKRHTALEAEYANAISS